MSKRSGSSTESAPRDESRPDPKVAAIPRGWLLGAVAILTAPWLAVAWVYFSATRPATLAAAAVATTGGAAIAGT